MSRVGWIFLGFVLGQSVAVVVGVWQRRRMQAEGVPAWEADA